MKEQSPTNLLQTPLKVRFIGDICSLEYVFDMNVFCKPKNIVSVYSLSFFSIT